MRLVPVFLLAAAVAQAQVPLPQYLRLKQYLELTDQQFIQMFDNLGEASTRTQEVGRRISELQREISIEMGRDNPDPMEIGTRQVEAEKICRIVRDENRNLVTKNRGILTEAQRTKLASLEEAGRLAALIPEAQGLRILGDVSAPLPTGQPGVVRISVTPAFPTLPPGVTSGPCTLSFIPPPGVILVDRPAGDPAKAER